MATANVYAVVATGAEHHVVNGADVVARFPNCDLALFLAHLLNAEANYG